MMPNTNSDHFAITIQDHDGRENKNNDRYSETMGNGQASTPKKA
jgi:hypothetical protein